ncbi:hypothetical protein KIH39_25095 [Telmatocola sphagniphila]|uniref:Uncharacterized protein n=1 Tax=Telmatocola sphagniphila TaxID=1123043 RepID=A0A8E6ET74_9BACT|nr:hypothetical protein [Telmatocola sphagniphila]QVL32074.1 hypothetical protein KIH39_25095 [Telmatocola sphagniphila]
MITSSVGLQQANRDQVEQAIETYRQIVMAARHSPKVEGAARKAQETLNAIFQMDRKLFSPLEIRWLNILCGQLAHRLQNHKPLEDHTRLAMRAGDSFDYCWRCETAVDERFSATCEKCCTKTFVWMICPNCRACGCQRNGKILI